MAKIRTQRVYSVVYREVFFLYTCTVIHLKRLDLKYFNKYLNDVYWLVLIMLTCMIFNGVCCVT